MGAWITYTPQEKNQRFMILERGHQSFRGNTTFTIKFIIHITVYITLITH
jgi:hypothetical protein